MGAASQFRMVGGQRVLMAPYKVKRPAARMLGQSGFSLRGYHLLDEVGLKRSFEKLRHNPVIWVPGGFGDTHWMMLKMESMIQKWFGGRKPVLQPVGEGNPAHNRLGPVLTRVPFVYFGGYAPGGPSVVGPALMNQVIAHGPGFDLLMYASRHVEAGKRIEEWLPSLDVNWDYTVLETEEDRKFGDEFLRQHGPFVLTTWFNTGYYPETQEDMSPERIIRLARKITKQIAPATLVLTGGWWDRPFHDHLALHGFPAKMTTGETTVGQLLAMQRRAVAWIGHQAGNTMMAQHLGCPTVLVWSKRWRNSPNVVHIDDKMWTCWVKPDRIGVVYDTVDMAQPDEVFLEALRKVISNKKAKGGLTQRA